MPIPETAAATPPFFSAPMRVKPLGHSKPRRIIGRENQIAHMALLREQRLAAPKTGKPHAKPKDLDRITGSVLSIEGVARLLFVNVDTVRRIPFNELPYTTGPGRRNLYLAGDIERYIRTKINQHGDSDMNLSARMRLIDSVADSVRGCSS